MKNVLVEQLLQEKEMFRAARETEVKEMISNGTACIQTILTPDGYSVEVFGQPVAMIHDQETVEMLHTVIRNSLIAAGVICDM